MPKMAQSLKEGDGHDGRDGVMSRACGTHAHGCIIASHPLPPPPIVEAISRKQCNAMRERDDSSYLTAANF